MAEIEVDDQYIHAKLIGSEKYTVDIHFDETRVLEANCNCPYDYGGYCKHIVHTLVVADNILSARIKQDSVLSSEEVLFNVLSKKDDVFFWANQSILDIPDNLLKKFSIEISNQNSWGNRYEIRSADFGTNKVHAIVCKNGYHIDNHTVDIQQKEDGIQLTCNCGNRSSKLCNHIYFVLREISNNQHLQLPFDTKERHRLLAEKANQKGWSLGDDLDSFFTIQLYDHRFYIKPKLKILAYTEQDKQLLKQQLLPSFQLPKTSNQNRKKFVVLVEPAYSKYMEGKLAEASLTKSGKIRSPIETLNLQNRLRHAQSREEMLFYAALIAMDKYTDNIEDYQRLLKNPLGLEFYYFKESMSSEKITPNKIVPITPQSSTPEVQINVKESGDFYVLTCQIKITDSTVTSEKIQFFGSLFLFKDTLYSLNNVSEKNVLDFFQQQGHEVYLHRAQLTSFKEEFLDKLEDTVSVSYSFVKPAPKKFIREQSLQHISQHIIYLSELEEFILITPAVSYGDVEVPLLSKRKMYTSNPDGSLYSIPRDETMEYQFLRNIQMQHQNFESIPETDFFYLHKKEFLEEGWFIEAFETWRTLGYAILGFNKLKNNRYNEHKINIKTSVQSGIDWFDIHTDISFGDQKVTLKQIQKSIVNKKRFIELGDGTQGILPEEWIEKFDRYFRTGEIKDDAIRTHKSNFQLIDELFEQEILSQEVQMELQHYKEKLANFHSIVQVKVPKKLKATLRDYQKEGLNWLHFLDEFGFGGCLADDMGLGKTVQIVAYFLSQQEKGNKQTNLVILPTSLLFNWQKEINKFAPSLKYLVLYGGNRKTEQVRLEDYHVILTTYGTLLSDIEFLKKQYFNIIVLDESQAIKNPDSKRYKAVRLLQGRQRLVLTGTPIENNTFDLYAQLSFALPGLLGSAKRFSTDYATPIDKFHETKRAKELQQKIHPFVLRRTKKQVATELPEKTEMVLYCEMSTEQRRVYDTYKIEFQKYLKGLDDDELQASSLHILQAFTKLRQICNSPALLGDDEYYGDQSAKLEELLEQINGLKDAHKILIFSQFVGMLELIKERLDQENISYAYLTGKTTNREEQVELFQEDEDVRIFLISLKAGGTGLNLTQAEYVFLIDPWWNPAVENQAIDRAYRIGQQNKVIAIRFITPDSIEEKIMDLQQRKRQLADDLIHTDGSMFKHLTKNDLLNLL